MPDSSRRSPLSVARAKAVFQLFSKSVKTVGRTESRAIVAFGVALMCGLISMVIAILHWTPGFLPVPALAAEQTLAMLVLIVLLSGGAGILASRPRKSRLQRLAAAPWPLLSLLLLPPHTSAEQAAVLKAPLPEYPPPQLEGNGRFFRASHGARFIGLGFLPLMVQLFGTGIALLFLGASLARMPAGSRARAFSYGIQLYVGLVGAWACHRCEKGDKRGSLAARRQYPWWPLALVPGLSILVPLALAERMTPGTTRRTGATELFFNRKTVRRESFTSELNLLPRMRGSELAVVGDATRAQSFLRCRAALLMLQMVACGVLWPLEFGSFYLEFLLSLGATTALFVGWLTKNLKAPERSALPHSGRVAAGWLTVTAGGLLLGLLMGSSLGHDLPLNAAGHMALLGTWGALLSALFLSVGSGWSSAPFRELVWVPVLLISMAAGMGGMVSPPIARPLGEALVLASVLAWLIELPMGLVYQRLFLEPFSLRDLARRDLPPVTKKRLLPIALALVMPLGGLANAVLAVAALRRDKLLLLWWEARGAKI